MAVDGAKLSCLIMPFEAVPTRHPGHADPQSAFVMMYTIRQLYRRGASARQLDRARSDAAYGTSATLDAAGRGLQKRLFKRSAMTRRQHHNYGN
jgi:hypothetical protein